KVRPSAFRRRLQTSSPSPTAGPKAGRTSAARGRPMAEPRPELFDRVPRTNVRLHEAEIREESWWRIAHASSGRDLVHAASSLALCLLRRFWDVGKPSMGPRLGGSHAPPATGERRSAVSGCVRLRARRDVHGVEGRPARGETTVTAVWNLRARSPA